MVCMTQNCVDLTQSSVIRMIYRNVSQKWFSHLSKCLLLLLVIVIVSFCLCILQGSVETHLLCGGIYNNHIVAKCGSERILKIGQ